MEIGGAEVMVDCGGVPLSREVVAPIVAEYLPGLAAVVETAWHSYGQVREQSRQQMAQASAASRGMLLSDFMLEPAHGIFEGMPGVRVDDRYGRPWVNLAGDTVQIRFRKLTTALGLCPSESQRAVRLGFHLGDPYLPGMPEATVLTAGYVLDAAESQIEMMALVCHIGFTTVHYSIPLSPRARQAVTQLPLAPLSEPIMRSARAAAERRLSRRGESS